VRPRTPKAIDLMAVLPARSRAEFKTGTRWLVEFAAERLATGASTPLDRRASAFVRRLRSRWPRPRSGANAEN
jgi:hypothetical protein